MKRLKKILKITFITLILLFLVLFVGFIQFTKPKSDEAILKGYENSVIKPVLTKQQFGKFNYRKIEVFNKKTLPTIVFIHGTIGSLDNYTKYLSDSLLQQKANMISYDRIGYNYNDKTPVQESIEFESNMLKTIIKDIPKEKLIIVGYSYGAPIALTIKEKIAQIVLVAPAVYSKVEPIPWGVKLYEWRATRWMLSHVWQQAAKEKMTHRADLKNFEDNWQDTNNKVLSIHGTKDWLAPFSNTLLLKENFKEEQVELVKVANGGHELVWSHFDVIKNELLAKLAEVD